MKIDFQNCQRRLLVSFSGGRSSGMMTHMVCNSDIAAEMKVVFANTGQEDDRTLDFVHRCATEWGINIVWVEAVIDPEKGKGTSHKVVTYETATRDPSLFEAMIEKYGIPNKNYPHCTRELKLQPITTYVRSLGWESGSYKTAIGIRADELDRVNPNFREMNLTYPLCDKGIKAGDVYAFWDKQPFDLNLPQHRGNCVWCWKKSLRKQLTLARETPQIFKFAMKMEAKHAETGGGTGKRVFFRDGRSAKQIIEMSRDKFEAFYDARYLDQNEGCEDGCELVPSQMSMIELMREPS